MLGATVLGMLGLLAAQVATQQFTVDGSALPPNGLWSEGVVVADLDGDGDEDIVFANGEGYGTDGGTLPQRYYRNDGGGTFTGVHGQLNVADMNAKMVIAEDFDGDGDLDLMFARMSAWPGPTKRPVLLLNQGGVQGGTQGVFADVSATNLPAVTMASFCVCAGDVDNDGDLDVVFTNGGTGHGVASQARLFLNDGAAVFTDVTDAQTLPDPRNAQDVTLFDFDGDWDIDIALSGKGQYLKRGRLWLNQGSGTFRPSQAMDDIGTEDTDEVDWGDLDGDGDWDAVVLAMSMVGIKEGWARNRGTSPTLVKWTLPQPNGNVDNEVALLDYDDDGDLDIFVGSLGGTEFVSELGGPEKAYRNDGAPDFVNVNSILQQQDDATLDLGFGDLDGDGDYDMVTAQGKQGIFANKVYVNSGPPDTRPPTVVRRRTPSSISDVSSVFLIDVRDAISDDGHVNVDATFSYSMEGGPGGTGQGTATRMGGGLYRAEVPTTGATTEVALTWTVTDGAGNSAIDGPHVVDVQAWKDIGSGHPGVTGVPVLSGTGKLIGGTPGALVVTNARPNAGGALFVAFENSPVPFYGGTLQANPPASLFVLTTDGGGSLQVQWAKWPDNVPGSFQLWLQFALEDGAAVGGFAMTNALAVTTP